MPLKGGAKGKTNSALKSWVTFVKKVQKDENISYPEAMKRAKVRKSEWKRGGAGDDSMGPMGTDSMGSMGTSSMGSMSKYGGAMSSSSSSSSGSGSGSGSGSASDDSSNPLYGGKRRKRTMKRKGSKKRMGGSKKRKGTKKRKTKRR